MLVVRIGWYCLLTVMKARRAGLVCPSVKVSRTMVVLLYSDTKQEDRLRNRRTGDQVWLAIGGIQAE
jgi:hypothetical protein